METSLRELTTLGLKNAENLAIPSTRNDVMMQTAFLFTVVGTTGFLGILAGQLPGVVHQVEVLDTKLNTKFEIHRVVPSENPSEIVRNPFVRTMSEIGAWFLRFLG
ncbi:hypothetical protein OROHE_011060 [Orobanche hederae]